MVCGMAVILYRRGVGWGWGVRGVGGGGAGGVIKRLYDFMPEMFLGNPN